MPAGKKLKLTLAIGGALGALLGVAVTLGLDTLYAGSMGGTWHDAIAGDLMRMFSMTHPPGGFIVSVIFVIIIFIHGLFGALLGATSAALVMKALEMLAGD